MPKTSSGSSMESSNSMINGYGATAGSFLQRAAAPAPGVSRSNANSNHADGQMSGYDTSENPALLDCCNITSISAPVKSLSTAA